MLAKYIFKKDILALKESVNAFMDSLAKSIVEEIRQESTNDRLIEARFTITNRVRGGKIQRRKKVSSVQGYRFQDGRLVRMSSREKLNRKRSQRKGAIKRRSTVASSLRKRKISIRKRGAI